MFISNSHWTARKAIALLIIFAAYGTALYFS